jgi:hypothetical protein
MTGASADPRDVLVKASPLIALRSFMDEHLTPDGVERVLAKAGEEFPEEKARLGQRVMVASERVPVVFVNRLIELTAGELRESPAAVAHRVGRRAAEGASTGVMRLAMVLISIPNLLRKLAPVWSQLYTHGTMSSSSEGKTATVELTDFPVRSKTGCGRITGWFEWFAQKAEKTATVQHYPCRAESGPVCRWTLRW